MHRQNGIVGSMGALLLGSGIAFAQPRPDGAEAFVLLEATIADVHAAMSSGRITCRELVQAYLDRLDEPRASGGLFGSLHCIPVLLKDQVETSDMPTTYGSDFVSSRDPAIMTKMKSASAIVLQDA